MKQRKLNNQKENLRICTHRQNSVNRPATSKNKIGYKGVTLNKNRYIVAQIKINRNQIRLGTFHDVVSAAKAYDKVAKEWHGEFAKLNFPEMEKLKQ